ASRWVHALPAARNSPAILPLIVRFLLGPARSLPAGLASYALALVIVVAPALFLDITNRGRAIPRREAVSLLPLCPALVGDLLLPTSLFLPRLPKIPHLFRHLGGFVSCRRWCREQEIEYPAQHLFRDTGDAARQLAHGAGFGFEHIADPG